MTTRRLPRALAAGLTAGALLVAGCADTTNMSSNRMVVAASISPLADFAKKVGGDLVEVELLVPAGASPHTFQLTPQQMNTLSKASVLILNGVGLEFWADKAISAADNPNLKVVRTADGLDIIDDVDEEHGKGGNPHVWLSPVCAISQVKAIRDAFIEADPRHKDAYMANAARFIADLDDLDSEIRRQVESFSTNKFVAFHPAWVYLARDYGLVQAAVIEKSPGVEPSPSEASDVVRTVRKIEARAIFAEPQFSPKVAEVIAQESGARVLILDPLGKPDDYDYIKMMRANLKQMAEALR